MADSSSSSSAATYTNVASFEFVSAATFADSSVKGRWASGAPGFCLADDGAAAAVPAAAAGVLMEYDTPLTQHFWKS